MESLDFGNVGIHSHESTERNSKIVSKSAFFSSLIFKIVNKFWVLSVLSGQYILKLENWSIDFNTSVFFENLDNRVDNLSPDGHLVRKVITSSFWAFYLKLVFLAFCFCLVSFVSLLLLGILCLGWFIFCWKWLISLPQQFTHFISCKDLGGLLLWLIGWLCLSQKIFGRKKSWDLIFGHEV